MAKITKNIRLKRDQKVALSNIMNAKKRPDRLFQFYGYAFSNLIIEIE